MQNNKKQDSVVPFGSRESCLVYQYAKQKKKQIFNIFDEDIYIAKT